MITFPSSFSFLYAHEFDNDFQEAQTKCPDEYFMIVFLVKLFFCVASSYTKTLFVILIPIIYISCFLFLRILLQE